MSSGTFLSWEEAQRLALPPNTALLIPPTPEPAEVAEVPGGAPPARPDWLDDGYLADGTPAQPAQPDPEELAKARGAAEREQYGPGPVRLLANLIAVNAVLEWATAPRRDDEHDGKKKKPLPPEPPPDGP